MDLAEELRKVFKLRDQIEEISQGNDYAGIQECWKRTAALLTMDMNETLRYLDQECTADEFSWISEVFDEVIDVTQSKRFIEALRRLAVKYPEETKEYNIISFIDSAEAGIRDEEESEQ
ncbi:MAG: hypothetical protein IKP86_10115 [Anaerolineaceae bacterium]|nr:hypothetical protein [Anaerolineaceae bacterium]